ANALRDELQRGEPRFSVFLDVTGEGFVAGRELKPETKRAVRSSTALIALVDRSAFDEDSLYMPGEVVSFNSLGKLVVPVDLDGCLRSARADARHREALPASELTRRMLDVLIDRITIEETS